MRTNWFLFLGRLHPLLVHLPIGCLAILAAVELAAGLHRFRGARDARGIILAAAAVAAAASVAAGLMLSSGGGYDHHLLVVHKWTGITLAALVVLTATAHWRRRRRAYVGLLIATLATLVPASHFGGSMTHGADYLTAYAPAWLQAMAGRPPHRLSVTVPAVRDVAAAHLYADVVRPILAQDCVSCHGPDRSSGRLRLDSLDAVHEGGQSGPDVELVLTRATLPAGDAKHMPPADQPQLTADQVDALRWWVATGGSDPSVAAANPSADQTALVGRLLHVNAAPPPDADAPRPWAEVAPAVEMLAARLNVGLTPVAVGQPWVDCDARSARPFGDRELAALAPLGRNVTSLDLAGTAVTDAGLAAVAAMPNLRALHLKRTAVTDAGLARLSHLARLESLDLYGTAVTDAGLTALRPLPNLARLYVWRTKVTPAAAAAFATARVDPARVREWQAQIADLQAKITGERVDVVGSTTRPSPGVAVAP